MIATPSGSVTRSLGFNGYRSAAGEGTDLLDFVTSMNARFSPTALGGMLSEIVTRLGAEIVSRSTEAYEPYGASAALLIGQPASELIHLDKSHVAMHTYIDARPDEALALFRIECDISSCGERHPFECLGLLVSRCEPDFALVDYRERGHEWRHDGVHGVHLRDAPIPEVPGYLVREMRGGIVLRRETLGTGVAGIAERLLP